MEGTWGRGVGIDVLRRERENFKERLRVGVGMAVEALVGRAGRGLE